MSSSIQIATVPRNNIFKGAIKIPASKSYSQRALALALISKETTIIKNLGKSDDEQIALNVLKDFGKKLVFHEDLIEVSEGVGSFSQNNSTFFSCGESGLAARMFTPILANSNYPFEISGHGSILNRPMNFFHEVFEKQNVSFESQNGKLPFKIAGPLIPKSQLLDGSISSQFITGIIYGFIASPFLKNEILTVRNLKSRPYVELSLDVLREFGVEINLSDKNEIHFNGPCKLKSTEISVEGDWSSASFFLVAAAIYGEVTIENLKLNSKQADIAILSALKLFGAEISVDSTICIRKKENRSFEFDATHCPDLFPPLVVLAARANGQSKIKGISRLKHKESDRANVLKSEFKKLGVKIELNYELDEMIIFPTDEVHFAKIEGNNDHRIVMASAILGLSSNNFIEISGAEAISKSFPEFFVMLNACIKNKTLLNDF